MRGKEGDGIQRMTPSSNKRQAAEKRGRKAEAKAELMLKLKGYRILARRFKSPVGEIDLIASKGSLFVFIEVKARKTFDEAFESITQKQKSRIEAAANHWLQQQSSQEFACRFDVIAVAPGKLPSHMKDAWRPGW